MSQNACFCAIFSMKMRYKQSGTLAWRDMAYVKDTTVPPFTHAVKIKCYVISMPPAAWLFSLVCAAPVQRSQKWVL